jgi:hypothetical protein
MAARAEVLGDAGGDFKYALQKFRSALNNAVQLPEEDQAAWKQVNKDFLSHLILSDAVKTTTEAAAEGFITPTKLTQSINKFDPNGNTQGTNPLAPLARAGNAVLKSLRPVQNYLKNAPFIAASHALVERVKCLAYPELWRRKSHEIYFKNESARHRHPNFCRPFQCCSSEKRGACIGLWQRTSSAVQRCAVGRSQLARLFRRR